MLDRDICNDTHGRIGPECMVFQAECQAIIHGIDLLEEGTETVHILVDNQAVVKSLDNPVTNNSTILHLKTTLNSLGRKRNVAIKWIKAHVGHYGNELADAKAKEGSQEPLVGPGPFYPVSKTTTKQAINRYTRDQWQARWNKLSDARQSHIFFPHIDLNKGHGVANLTKRQIGPVVRALTGHDFRGRHTAILEKTLTPACRFCKMGEETPSHVILYCPRLTNLRARCFLSYTGQIIQSWTPLQMASFLLEPTISNMET